MKFRTIKASIFAVVLVSACGGGSGAPSFTVGGTVSGLNINSTLVLGLNSTDTLTITTSGSFAFPRALAQNSSYAVNVTAQPTGQNCSVMSGSGVLNSNVNSVSVSCTTNVYSVAGAVTGVAANQPLSVALNGGETLPLAKDGTFEFSTKVTHGTSYSIVISKSPLGQTCTVTNGTGTALGPISNVSINCSAQPYFAELAGALAISYPPGTSSIVTVEAADVNGDKRQDLIVHFLGSPYWGKSVGNVVAPNAVRLYVQQTDGKFEDQTSTLVSGTTDLGGWSRKLKVDDVNNDGKPDFLFAINQEDGRLQAVSTDMNAQMAALVSTGSKYRVTRFGAPSWYHSIGLGRDSKGSVYVTGNGYTFSGPSRVGYQFDSSGDVSPSSVTLPDISPTAFELFNSQGGQSWTGFLLQANNSSTNYLDVEGYAQQPDGKWQKLANLSFAGIAGEFSAVNWTGEPGPGIAFNLDGVYLSWAGLSESCQMKLSPNSETVVLFSLGGGVIPNFAAGGTYKQNDSKAYRTTRAAKIVNGQIVQVPLRFINEQTANLNSNFFDCRDVNNDGYADLAVYRYNTLDNSEYIHVYLNDRSGGFRYIGQESFPAFPFPGNQGWTSLLRDFDNDGVPDLLLYPSSATSTSWRFFKGLKQLQ